MPLTDSRCRTAKAREKRFKMSDGRGLYLLVLPGGTKVWYHRYSFEGRQRDEPLGEYPTLLLAEARRKRDAARLGISAGRDPREPEPGSAKPAPAPVDRKRLFRSVAEEWFERKKRPTLEARTATRQWARIRNLFPVLGDMDVAEITSRDVLKALHAVEERGAIYTTRRVRALAEAIFDYADIPYGVSVNPATPKLLQNLSPVPPARNQPAMPFDMLPGFFVKLRSERCAQAQDDTRTRLAVELILNTVLRTDELRHGQWDQIVGDEWHLPAAAMKRVNGEQRDHIVPLNRRAREVLKELRPYARKSVYIFPGRRPGHLMSENTMGNWMKARGYQDVATIHGFRSTFSTHANESGLWEPDWIEVQLAHVDSNKVRGIYNKAVYLEHRKRLMDWWGDELAKQEAIGLRRVAVETELADLLG